MTSAMRTLLLTLLTASAAVMAGCAGAAEPDTAADVDVPKCRSGETYSCVERMGRRVRCFCADKDTLRELLEPTTQ